MTPARVVRLPPRAAPRPLGSGARQLHVFSWVFAVTMIPPLHFTRARYLVALGTLVFVAGACERIAVGPQIAGQLRAGRAYAERLIQHPPALMQTGADSERV